MAYLLLGALLVGAGGVLWWRCEGEPPRLEAPAEELPADPTALSYQLADRIQVPLERKQRWLEADLVTRLREICGDLKAELAILPAGRRRPGGDPAGLGNLN